MAHMTEDVSSSSYRDYYIPAFFAAMYFLFFSILAMGHPLCCADDSSFAVVSKNVAHGLGYALTLNYRGPEYAPHLFDPALGTGPTLILSAAGMIKLFGATPWAPGEATVLLCAFFLFGIGTQLKHILGAKGASVALTAFLTLATLSTAYDYHYWSAELGEAPATLAIILGYLLWANRSQTKRHIFFAGFLLALSFLTKELSALYVVALFLFAFFRSTALSMRSVEARHEWIQLFYLIVGMTLPVLAFETYRLISLGSLHAYIQNWSDHLDFVSSQGSTNNVGPLVERVAFRLREISDRFSIPAYVCIVGSIVITWGTVRAQPRHRELTLALALGFALHAGYWLFISNGWVRYAFSFILIWIFFLACQISIRNLRGILALIASVALATASLPHTHFLWSQWIQALKGPPPMQNERQLLAYLKDQRASSPIYTGWWAQVANLEYLADKPGTFKGYQLAYKDERSEYIVVTNSAFPANQGSFNDILSKCHAGYASGNYTAYSCQQPEATSPELVNIVPALPDPKIVSDSCNLEYFNGITASSTWDLKSPHNFVLSGWLLDPETHSIPRDVQVVLTNAASLEAWSVPILKWQDRPDVAAAKHTGAYLQSGFTVHVKSAGLAKGSYEISLRYTSANEPMKCDNGRRLSID